LSEGRKYSPVCTARTATAAPHVTLVSLHLFGAIPISTHSDQARKFLELAIDKKFILAQEKLGNSAAAQASRTWLKYLRASTVEFLVADSASSKER
jgi:hypothetical protein